MVFTVVTMTVKSFAGNWVDIGPGADDGQVTWCSAGLGRALIAPRGWMSNMSSRQCPVSQVPAQQCPRVQLGSSQGTRLPLGCHTHGTGVLSLIFRLLLSPGSESSVQSVDI